VSADDPASQCVKIKLSMTGASNVDDEKEEQGMKMRGKLVHDKCYI
jgi:hypothetical protein